MRYFSLELADRAVSMATQGRVLTSAPSAVFDGTAGGLTGANAWRELRIRPRAISTRHLGAVLTQRGSSVRSEALLEAELKTRFAEQPIPQGQRIWIVAPAQAEAAGLAALLGITRRLGLPVAGFVDSATVVAAALGVAAQNSDQGDDHNPDQRKDQLTDQGRGQGGDQSTIVLELGLHHAAATSVDSDGTQARRRRAVQTDRGGLIELYQAWLDLISTTMVKRTRFDPLHDAATEQQVFEAIESLTLEAARTGSATASVMKGAERFEAALTRDQFSQVAQPIYRSIIALLHQLRPAGVSVSIVMPQSAARLPGFREQLEQFVGCELVSVPDGFAAAATSLFDMPEPRSDDAEVSLLRRLPIAAQAAILGTPAREQLGQRRVTGPAPSHVLWDGRAYSLSPDSLVVGRGPSGPSNNSRHVTLPDGLAGVSRRHCTFVHDGDELVLLDHSTFGTFVNGERVQERARIYAGDHVRLGEPGAELSLIAVGEVAATTQQP